jgi:hypothetical protein
MLRPHARHREGVTEGASTDTENPFTGTVWGDWFIETVLHRTELQRSQQASSEILYVLTSDMEDMVADPSGGRGDVGFVIEFGVS